VSSLDRQEKGPESTTAEPRPGNPRICVVSGDLGGLEGAEATRARCRRLAEHLKQRGWDVEVLGSAGMPQPVWDGIPTHGDGLPALLESQRAFEALVALHSERPFDLIEFPALGALGFRSVQAKRSGLAFAEVPLAVTLQDPSSRGPAPASGWAPWELKLDWCERYAIGRADLQLGLSSPDGPEAERRAALERFRADRPRDAVGRAPPPTVSVAVTHHNHAAFLPAALGSLAAQRDPPEEVFVIDDGSTDPEAREVFARMEREHTGWTFLRQENAGPGVARNRCLGLATGDTFLPFDSDNIALPELVASLRTALAIDPGRAVATCQALAFEHEDDIDAGTFAFRYAPTGGPRLLAAVENVFGDSCALYRASALRAVGGFEAMDWSPYEDWETMVKLAFGGFDVDVVPRPLFWYRTGVGGRQETLAGDPATEWRLRRRIIEEFLVDVDLEREERIALWELLASAGLDREPG
jgi:GT2 family glycosyltransferase